LIGVTFSRAGVATAGAIGLPPRRMRRLRSGRRFDLCVSEVELRPQCRRPDADGPDLPAERKAGPSRPSSTARRGVNRKDRFAEEPMDRALAGERGCWSSPSIWTIAPSAYPACIRTANWSARWLRRMPPAGTATSPARCSWLVERRSVAEIVGMKPGDPRYASIALAGAPDVRRQRSLRRLLRRSSHLRAL